MDKSNLFSIGEFARATGTTIKALRYYDMKNILKPSCVDSESGYRYYSLYQINQLELVGIFTDLGICLNQFNSFIDCDFRLVNYQKLLQAGKSLIQDQIQTLECKMRYIDYLKTIDKSSTQEHFYPTHPLWLMPCSEKPDKISIERAIKKISHEITTYGLTLFQSYGLIMICNGSEKRLYYFADVKSPSDTPVIHEKIFYLPQGDYRSIEQNEWNIEIAPELFKDLFAIHYDKVIIERELTCNAEMPSYSLSCLLPPDSARP